jgi:Dolichyl-phosphate-mannose-protein mannosyltransferase
MTKSLAAFTAKFDLIYKANETIIKLLVFFVLFAIYLIGVMGYSFAKPIWYDELSTVFITRLKTLGDIWAFLQVAADHNPPGLHFLVWLTRQVIPNELIAVRLPSMLGYFLMSVSLYRFAARRLGTAAGLVAGLFPIVSIAQEYAYEARPYTLMMGFCGAALVCWQASEPGRWRRLALVGLAGSIALALLSHYYAVPLLIALAGGELIRT